MNTVELPRWDAQHGDVQRCLADIDRWAMVLRDSGASRHSHGTRPAP